MNFLKILFLGCLGLSLSSAAQAERRPFTADMKNLRLVEFGSVGSIQYLETAQIDSIQSLGVLRDEGEGSRFVTMTPFVFYGSDTEPDGRYSTFEASVHFGFLRPSMFSDFTGGTAFRIDRESVIVEVLQRRFTPGNAEPEIYDYDSLGHFSATIHTENWNGSDLGPNELFFSFRRGPGRVDDRWYRFTFDLDIRFDPKPLHPADFNGDGVVNGADFLIWMANFGGFGKNRHSGDADHDYNTDGDDFLLWQTGFGQ